MSALRTCPGCGNPLPADAPAGLCPVCLLKTDPTVEPKTGAATINVDPAAEAGPGSRVAPSPAQLAAHFPQLEIIELLGMGGMGMVYKARQPRLDRFVALKILPVDSATHPSFAERFSREAKALAKLNHPGIVAVYDFGQTGQYYYFIMEFVDGMNLRHLLDSHTVTPRQALELVVQICTALQYAHDEGVVHRDIKPENILLNKKGQVKIADFGLAKLLGAAPDTALTLSQAAMGTLNYMAPEQRENAQKVDHRADIYSLGVVFYEMLTGEVPMGRFAPPSQKVRVDVRLDKVVLRALEREPERRYQQASEVKTGVEAVSTPKGDEGETGARENSVFFRGVASGALSSAAKSFSTIGLVLLSLCLLSVLIPASPFAWVYNDVEIGSVKSAQSPNGVELTVGPVSEVTFPSSGFSTWHGKGIAAAALLCGAFFIATLRLARFGRLQAFGLTGTGLLVLGFTASFIATPLEGSYLSKPEFESLRNLPAPTPTGRIYLGDEQRGHDLQIHGSWDALKLENDRVHWMRTPKVGSFITLFVGLGLVVLGCRRILTAQVGSIATAASQQPDNLHSQQSGEVIPGAFKPQPPPAFPSYVLWRFSIFVLVWLGIALCLRWMLPGGIAVDLQSSTTIRIMFSLLGSLLGLFYLGWAKFILPAGFLLVVYAWLEARERRGLSIRKLPPQIRRRFALWSAVTAVGILVIVIMTCWLWFLFIGGFSSNSINRGFLTMEQEHSEWWFVPNSGAYERIGLNVAFSSVEQNGKRDSGSPPGCTVSLIAYRKGDTNLVLMTANTNPAVMKVTLPGLRAQYQYKMENQKFMPMTTILDKGRVIDWLQAGTGLDSTKPAFQKEAGEIYGLLKSYETVPPQTVLEFVNLAKAELRDFWFGGMQGGSFSYGGAAGFVNILSLITVETLLYMGLYLWLVKRIYRDAWAEIAAGRWAPTPATHGRVEPRGS